MIKGICFDKDGVLFDMEPVYCRTSIDVLAKHNIDLSEEEYYEFWTRKGGNLTEFLKSKRADFDLESVRQERSAAIRDSIKRHVPYIEGAREMVEALTEIYPSSLVTSSYRASTDLLLGISGLRKYFRSVITIEDVAKGKPDPEGFLHASRLMGIQPESILVIEDAEKGVVAARCAGMKVIAVPNEYTRHNDFSLADYILKDIREITPEFVSSI